MVIGKKIKVWYSMTVSTVVCTIVTQSLTQEFIDGPIIV